MGILDKVQLAEEIKKQQEELTAELDAKGIYCRRKRENAGQIQDSPVYLPQSG